METRRPTNKDVLSFIDRFTENGTKQEVIDTFSYGCCYWFAKILWCRFVHYTSNCDIVYDQVINHWACEIEGRIYDIRGDITDHSAFNWEVWHVVTYNDPALSERLYRDCIDF